MEVIGDFLVLGEGVLPAVALDADELAFDARGPSAEVVNLAANLLLPSARRMGREGKFGRGLLGPVRCFPGTLLSSRIKGYGATSTVKGSGGVASGGERPPGATLLFR
jgi:hypothetical protein